MSSRSTTMAAGGALLLVVAVAFWPVVTGARSFFHLDLRYEIVPLWHVSQESIRSGRAPFWIDGEYCGHPALLRQEVALFYPLTVPLLAADAPPHRLADLFSLFHFWLAGFAAFLLLRDLACDVWSSLFGGVAWMLSARLLQSAIWPNAVAVSAFLPLILMGVLRIGRGERRSGVSITAIASALALLAFRPQVLVGAMPLLLAAAFAAVATSAARGRALGDLVLSAVLALALSAPAWVPAAALAPVSSRAGGLEREDRDIRPIRFDRDLDQVLLPVDGRGRWPEAAAYPGALVALLFLAGAFLALARGVFPRALYAAIAAGGIVGFVFAFGESGPYALFADLPILRSFRIPARFLTSWGLALALGAGMALSALLARSRRARALGVAAVTFLLVDLVWHARAAASTAPAAIGSIEPAIMPLLRNRLASDELGFPRRYWSLAYLTGLVGMSDDAMLSSARSNEPVGFGLGMRFGLESVIGQGPTLRRTAALVARPTQRAVELTGASIVILPAPGRTPPFLVRSYPTFPRAILVPEARLIPSSAALAATLDPALDPKRTAVVEGTEPLEPASEWSADRGSVRLVSRGPGRMEIGATLPATGILVVFESFEKGWTAMIDGDAAEVFRADAAFLGVRVPKGTHNVRLAYRPRGLREGAGLAVAGLLALALAARRIPARDDGGALA